MKLAEPPGIRSCRDGGEWSYCRAGSGGSYFMAELESLKNGLLPNEFTMARQELKGKMGRAMVGALTYGTAQDGGDVEKMRVVQDVLELRLQAYTGSDEDTVHVVRLYFSEPEELPRVLLALHLTWKVPGPMMKSEQDQQAKVASKRCHEHGTRA